MADSADKSGVWRTINGVHVFIRDGESPTDALNRTVAKANEIKKADQIAKQQAQADKLNGKQAMETKILKALTDKVAKMQQYDADRQAEYDDYMKKANAQTNDYWKKDLQNSAEWALHFQKHGYDFLESWKNEISKAMYGREYHQWHSAQAGRYKGTGHGAYVTTELTPQEIANVDAVFQGLIKHGYLKLSKSGKQATFINKK